MRPEDITDAVLMSEAEQKAYERGRLDERELTSDDVKRYAAAIFRDASDEWLVERPLGYMEALGLLGECRRAISALEKENRDLKGQIAWLEEPEDGETLSTQLTEAKEEIERLRINAKEVGSDLLAENAKLREVLGGFVKNRGLIKAPEFDGVLDRLMDMADALVQSEGK
jgi:hypothetical protein